MNELLHAKLNWIILFNQVGILPKLFPNVEITIYNFWLEINSIF
jgi:hypothetical protein